MSDDSSLLVVELRWRHAATIHGSARLPLALLAAVGLCIGVTVAAVGGQRSTRWRLGASMLLLFGVAAVAGLTWFGGQLGDGDQFDAPRERLTIRNDSAGPLYLLVPGSAGLTASQLADSRFFVNGATVQGQTVPVILRDGSWSGAGESCLTEEFVIVTSRQGQQNYSHNVRDASGQIISPTVSAEDLVVAHRQSDGCWQASDSFLAWDGRQLSSLSAPATIPRFVGWLAAAALSFGVPLLWRRRGRDHGEL